MNWKRRRKRQQERDKQLKIHEEQSNKVKSAEVAREKKIAEVREYVNTLRNLINNSDKAILDKKSSTKTIIGLKQYLRRAPCIEIDKNLSELREKENLNEKEAKEYSTECDIFRKDLVVAFSELREDSAENYLLRSKEIFKKLEPELIHREYFGEDVYPFVVKDKISNLEKRILKNFGLTTDELDQQTIDLSNIANKIEEIQLKLSSLEREIFKLTRPCLKCGRFLTRQETSLCKKHQEKDDERKDYARQIRHEYGLSDR